MFGGCMELDSRASCVNGFHYHIFSRTIYLFHCDIVWSHVTSESITIPCHNQILFLMDVIVLIFHALCGESTFHLPADYV
jgi:hypothetical protein